MSQNRKVEVFSAGCSICDDVVTKIKEWACESCDVIVLDTKEDAVVEYAKELGIGSVPAVAVDGVVANCCAGRGINEDVLRSAGLGQPIE